MKLLPTAFLGLCTALAILPASASSALLSGTVLDIHGQPLSGVTVSLVGAKLSARTDSSGRWSLFQEVATNVDGHTVSEKGTSGRLLLDSERPRLRFAGRDIAGRGVGELAVVVPKSVVGARRSEAYRDTLTYALGGTIRLRDTATVPGDTSLVRVLDTTVNPKIIHGYLVDGRDGNRYRTVVIGVQTWMAENLNYEAGGSYCYGDSAGGCTLFGRLYLWDSLYVSDSSRQGVCPKGWSVPSDSQWQALEEAVGMDTSLVATTGWRGTQGFALKAPSPLWDGDAGTDLYGFHVLPGGYRYNGGGYGGFGADAYFWTSSGDPYVAIYRLFSHGSAKIGRNTNSHPNGLSVRCLKDVP